MATPAPSPQHDDPQSIDRSAAKASWMLVYEAASPSITHEMLDTHGFSPTECHTLVVKDQKFTYFRLCRRVRAKQIKAFMRNANQVYDVQYDEGDPATFISDDKKDFALAKHPIFRRIRALVSSEEHGIETWTEPKSEITQMRLMKRFNEASDEGLMKRHLKVESALEAAHDRIKDLTKKNSDLKANLKKAKQNKKK